MNKLFYLFAILLVGCSKQDVRVINKPDEPLPVAVQGAAKVEVTNLPASQKVEVTNLPASQKVEVTNLQGMGQFPPQVRVGKNYRPPTPINDCEEFTVLEVRAFGWAKVRLLNSGNWRGEILLNLNLIPTLRSSTPADL